MIRLSFRTAVLSCFLATALHAQSQPPSPAATPASQEQQQEPKAQQPNPAESPVVSPPVIVPQQQQIEPPPTPRPAENASEQNQQSPPDWITWASGLSNIVIALVTIALAYVAWKQAGYMRDGLTETCKAAEAAKKSADVAEKSLQSQRAQLMTSAWRISNIEAGKTPLVNFTITNKGALPATLVQIAVRFLIERSLPEIPPGGSPQYTSSFMEAGFLVVPGQGYNRKVKCWVLSPEEVESIENGTKKLWFLGAIKFIDGLDKQRILRMCMVYDLESKQMVVEREMGYHEPLKLTITYEGPAKPERQKPQTENQS